MFSQPENTFNRQFEFSSESSDESEIVGNLFNPFELLGDNSDDDFVRPLDFGRPSVFRRPPVFRRNDDQSFNDDDSIEDSFEDFSQ